MISLVKLESQKPNILVDLPYATEDNFMHEVLYTHAHCYICIDAAHALDRVQQRLSEIDLGLLVWDAFRPIPVQQKMWDRIQDERYVSNPKTNKGRHTRGTAVDVTLIDYQGNQLKMPTPFDDFSERGHSGFMNLPEEILLSRELLKNAMEAEGFIQLPTEWWHFDYIGWEDDEEYPAITHTLEELSQMNLPVFQFTTHSNSTA